LKPHVPFARHGGHHAHWFYIRGTLHLVPMDITGKRRFQFPKVLSIRFLIRLWDSLYKISAGVTGLLRGVIMYFLTAYPLSPTSKPSPIFPFSKIIRTCELSKIFLSWDKPG
jgi:hypothetical protein